MSRLMSLPCAVYAHSAKRSASVPHSCMHWCSMSIAIDRYSCVNHTQNTCSHLQVQPAASTGAQQQIKWSTPWGTHCTCIICFSSQTVTAVYSTSADGTEKGDKEANPRGDNQLFIALTAAKKNPQNRMNKVHTHTSNTSSALQLGTRI